MPFLANLSLTFAAGVVGGLINSLAVWLCGLQGLNQALGVQLAPALTPAFLYPRLVWGGLWGWLFLIPGGQGWRWRQGLLFSLAPSALQLFYIFPHRLHKGFLGWDLGLLTPLLVLIFNGIWGLATAFWLSLTTPRSRMF
jgi:hypothetical protein